MILDINDNEIQNPDLSKGYLKDDVMTVHHDAVDGVEEQYHYEVVMEYPNGGKDVEKVIDVPGVVACDEYDEQVDILRYIEYTSEELEAKQEAEEEAVNEPSIEDRLTALEEALLAVMEVSE